MNPRPRDEPVEHPAAAGLLNAVVQARSGWLATTVTRLRHTPFVTGVWLVGSLAQLSADAYSDIDLVIAVDPATPAAVFADPVTELELPGPVLFTRPKPRNAPAGGAYLAVCVELAGLPVLVDLYVWPATTAAVPAGGAVLYQRGAVRRSPLELLALLAEHPADDPAGADPDDPATLLFLIQLAAKYHARGDQQRRAALYRQLHLDDQGTTVVVRQLLESQVLHPGLGPAVAAVRSLLDLADTQPSTRPPLGSTNGADP